MIMPENRHRQNPSRFGSLTSSELEHYARRAEQFMNRGLEQHRWNVVRAHRNTMLALEAERRRRNRVADTAASQATGREAS